MGRKKRSKLQALCVYCGIRVATTKDHVVPKCLFTRPLSSDMVTIPVCEICNLEKSKDEDYLRDMLVVDYSGSQHPVAQEIFKGKVLRSASKNRSEIVRTALRTARSAPLFTRAGIYVGNHPTFQIDRQRVTRMFSFIIRGLYYKVIKERLPDDFTFEVDRLDSSLAGQTFYVLKELGGNGPYTIGNGLFGCVFIYGAEDPSVTFWLLWFYNSVFFTAYTNFQDDGITAS